MLPLSGSTFQRPTDKHLLNFYHAPDSARYHGGGGDKYNRSCIQGTYQLDQGPIFFYKEQNSKF